VVAALLLLPAAAMVLRDEGEFRRRFRRYEKRAPEAFSPRRVDAWFNDGFGFRNELVALNNALTYAFALPNDKVVVGTDGWLYLGNRYNQIVDQATGASVFSDEQLKGFGTSLQQRQRYLGERGVPFVFAVAPNGHTVYADHLPAWARNRRGVSMLGQVELEVRRRRIPYADLRAALAQARRTEARPLYYKTDSHWNAVGAWVAYRQIMGELAPRLPGLRPLAGVEFEPVSGERARAEKLPGIPVPDDLYAYRTAGPARPLEFTVDCRNPGARPDLERIVEKKFGIDGVLVNSLPEGCECTATAAGADGGLRALVIGDSFSQALSPLFNQTFASTTYTHHRQAASMARFKSLVQKYEPDVVIFVVVERLLNQALRPRGKRAALPAGEEP
jgi:hypothetical protein